MLFIHLTDQLRVLQSGILGLMSITDHNIVWWLYYHLYLLVINRSTLTNKQATSKFTWLRFTVLVKLQVKAVNIDDQMHRKLMLDPTKETFYEHYIKIAQVKQKSFSPETFEDGHVCSDWQQATTLKKVILSILQHKDICTQEAAVL